VFARGFEAAVAKKYLLRPPADGFISLNAILSAIAIAIGVWALIFVMSIMNGYRVNLLDKILGYHGHVLVQGYGGEIKDYQALTDRLAVYRISGDVNQSRKGLGCVGARPTKCSF